MSADFTVYGHFASQPAARVVLFLRMAGIPFDYRHVDLKSGAQKTPDYLAISRFGRVPALVHGGAHLSESGVILTYLAKTTGRFGSDETLGRYRLGEWLSWLADVLMPLQRTRALRRFGGDPQAIPYMDKNAATGLNQMEALLSGRPFIDGGAVTIADIFAFPWIDLANEGNIDIAAYPAVQDWYRRMLAQPGCATQYTLMPTEDRPAADWD
ncbi:glutathione S-transferase [Azospirillum fermentarium]|uniref:glutathione S-transferase family protein n=1 Tax=Azospirillum fermentarium TaxID=1233114 RepID=UPI00222788D1|nr:glutathione S-transferase family protein [Azospirillum fermentarium]MCW2246065.1 glutathione S-transferase [Azospirillum fermentarium]